MAQLLSIQGSQQSLRKSLGKKNVDKKPFCTAEVWDELWWLDHGTKKKWNYSCFLFLADWKECGQLLLIISGRSLQAGHGYQESKGW